MKATLFYTAGAIALTATIAACIPSVDQPVIVREPSPVPASTPAPPPPPAPVATPAPTPTAAPTPRASPVVQQAQYRNYLDAPQTTGTWTYAVVNGGTIARFGSPNPTIFAVGCMANSHRVVLIREDIGPHSNTAVTIRTETLSRTLTAQPNDERDALSAALDANDPLLDAMAITKGRFAVAADGEPTLYLPAWVEVTRVIEDCR